MSKQTSSPSMRFRFRTKLILVAVASVLVALLLSSTVALRSFTNLGSDASQKIEKGLGDASKEYLENYIETTALRTSLMLNQAFSELQILGELMQWLIDHPEENNKIGEVFSNLSAFQDKLSYDRQGNWHQNDPEEQSVVSVWGHLLKDGQIRPDVVEHIKKTAILDLILPVIKNIGANKLYMYMVGPRGQSYLRLTPFVDMATEFDRLYPGHNKQDFWDFFFPGIVDGWQKWPDSGMSRKELKGRITITEPYLDAAGGGIIVSCFYPLWEDNYKKFAGAAALDFSLSQIVDLIKGVKLAKTGFAFFAQSKGNVLAVNEAGEKILGVTLKTKGEEEVTGVNLLDRNLTKSTQAEIRALRLPQDDKIHIDRANLDGTNGEKSQYVIVTKRMQPLLTYMESGLNKEHWTLGFVVPEKEIYEALFATQKSLNETVQRTLLSQIWVAIVSLLIVMLGVLWVSRRMTSGLISLAAAAGKLKNKDYTVRVDIRTRDEIRQLGSAFNGMAAEIQQYTENLENLVRERTKELEEANTEISALNEMLKEENLRLGAEMEVAQRLQLMVLPKKQELDAVKSLDIAGHMSPADEVGGDYYDVLTTDSLVKIGIGDVTGHGLRSGVLMLMVQSITRTLLDSGEYDPVNFLVILNQVLYKNIRRIDTQRNLTLSFIDYMDGNITLSGQHEEVIIVRSDGTLKLIDTMDLGFPIGLEPNVDQFIATTTFRLHSDDVVVLFTDGITEAEDINQKQFGIERLCESIMSRRMESAEKIKDGVVADVMAHIGEQKIFDDISLVAIKGL